MCVYIYIYICVCVCVCVCVVKDCRSWALCAALRSAKKTSLRKVGL